MTLSESKSTATWGSTGQHHRCSGAEIHASATAQTGSIIGSSAIITWRSRSRYSKDLIRRCRYVEVQCDLSRGGQFLTARARRHRLSRIRSEYSGWKRPVAVLSRSRNRRLPGIVPLSPETSLVRRAMLCSGFFKTRVRPAIAMARFSRRTQPIHLVLSMAYRCNRFVNETAKSYRVFLVPIIDSLCNGSCDVTVLAFAMFFIGRL